MGSEPENLYGWCTGVFAETFGRLHRRGVLPEVLYPAVQVPSDAELAAAAESAKEVLPGELVAMMEGRTVFLSINRFERKKVMQKYMVFTTAGLSLVRKS